MRLFSSIVTMWGRRDAANLICIRGRLLPNAAPRHAPGQFEPDPSFTPGPLNLKWSTDMKTLLKKFVRDESGAALVEYGIALLVVILVGTGALVTLAGNTGQLFQGASNASTASVTAATEAGADLDAPPDPQ